MARPTNRRLTFAVAQRPGSSTHVPGANPLGPHDSSTIEPTVKLFRVRRPVRSYVGITAGSQLQQPVHHGGIMTGESRQTLRGRPVGAPWQ